MDNDKSTQLLNSIFFNESNTLLNNTNTALICPIENDNKIPELIDFLSSTEATRDQINDICTILFNNFHLLRMNVIRFLKAITNKDFPRILFDFYLQYKEDPIPSILNLLSEVLFSGSTEEMTINWLYEDISFRIREKTITPLYISRYLELLKCFYNFNDEEINGSKLCEPHSYFFFYPQPELSYGFKMEVEDFKNLAVNEFGMSIWFKLPYYKNNFQYLIKEGNNVISFNLAEIGLSNDKMVIICIELCKSNNSYKVIIHIDKDKDNDKENYELMSNQNIDSLTHLYFQIDKTHLYLYLNKEDKLIIPSSILSSNPINSLSLFKNFFGEVHSLVIYSINDKDNQSQELMINDLLIDFHSFTQKILNSNKAPDNVLFVYYPYANGDNIWKNYDFNKEPSLLLSSPGRPYKGVYNHYSIKDTISKYYGAVSLLPILEHCYINRNSPEYIKHNDILVKLIDLIPCKPLKIDNGFTNEDFFFVFSMFAERMPNEYINETFGKKLIDLFFVLMTDNTPMNSVLLNFILLNENILQKYPAKYDAYKQINIIQNGTDTQIWTTKFLIQSLVNFDKNKYKEYCCEKHKEAFHTDYINFKGKDKDKDKEIEKVMMVDNVMNPSLIDKINTLSYIIIEKLTRPNKEIEKKVVTIEDLKYLSKLLYIDCSPCLTLGILEIIKKVITEYNQEVFTDICYTLSSPFRDIKNASLLLINYILENAMIEKTAFNTLLHQGLFRYIKLNVPMTQLELSAPSLFSYNFKCGGIMTTTSHLIQFIILIDQPNDINDIIHIILEALKTINKHTQDNNYHCLRLFIDLIKHKIQNPNDPNIKANSKLIQLLNDSLEFHQYILSILAELIESNNENVLPKCNKFYVELIVSSQYPSISLETLFKIIFGMFTNSDSSNNVITSTYKAITTIIQESLKLLSSSSSNQYIECIISVYKYYTSIETLRMTLENSKLNDRLKLLQNAILLNGENTLKFFKNTITALSHFWNKDEYQLGGDNIIYSTEKKNFEAIKEKLMHMPDIISLFTLNTFQKNDNIPLLLIIALMYISLIDKAKNNSINNNENDQLAQTELNDLIEQYHRFLCFVIVLASVISQEKNSYSIVSMFESEQKNIHSFIVEVMVIGFNCLFNLSQKSYELLGIIFYCIDDKQLAQWKKAANKPSSVKKNSQSALMLFLCSLNQTQAEKIIKIIKDSKKKINYDLLKETYVKRSYLSNQINSFYQRCYIEGLNENYCSMSNSTRRHSSSGTDANGYFKMSIDHKQRKEEINKDFYKKHKNSLLTERKKKLRYQLIKKYLYSWNRPWSDKQAFYPNAINDDQNKALDNHKGLKVKLCNYYSQSFIRPFVSLIKDIDFYFPEMPQLDFKELFNDKDTKVKSNVDLNIDKIISDGKPNNIISNDNDNDDNKMQLKYNCLYHIHKIINTNSNNSIDSHHSSEIVTNDIRKISEDIQIQPKDKAIPCLCCLIKPSRHIKGTIDFKDDYKYLEFKPFIDQVNPPKADKAIDTDFDYDIYKQTCFGSFLKYYPKDSLRNTYKFSLDSMTHLILKKYYFRHTAMEIFTIYHKSYLLNFSFEANRDKVYQILKAKLKDTSTVIIDDESKKSAYVNMKKDEWRNWKISNLHFLMILNIAGNRSFNDLSQYPVVPWILADYTSMTLNEDKQLIDTVSIYRDLTKPMGMLEFSNDERTTVRKAEYIANYTTFQKPNKNSHDDNKANSAFSKPFFFGSHYSNPIYITHFLLRLFPMIDVMIELHDNKLDDPNRLFTSIQATFEGASTQKGDVRELIPEFYFLSDMFINVNDFNLGLCRNDVKVDNVICPQWANSNPFDFVVRMRQFLENDVISSTLHSWIDLIFGAKQRGNEAKEANNLFMPMTYGDMFKVNENTSKEDKEYYYRLVEFGIIPKQVFTSSLEPRKQRPDAKTNSTILKQDKRNSYNNNYSVILKAQIPNNNIIDVTKSIDPLNSYIWKIKCISPNKVYLVRYNSEVECIKYSISNNNLIVKSECSFPYSVNNTLNSVVTNKMKRYSYIREMPPLLINGKGDTFIQGGQYEGQITLTFSSQISLSRLSIKSPISYLTMNKDETIILSGSINGAVTLIDSIKNTTTMKRSLVCKKIFFDHTNEVNCIFISNELNAFASCAKDNYVHLYTFPKGKMIRSFHVNQCEQVFISDSPLPSIVIYSLEHKDFYCYTVNGFYLRTVREENCILKRLKAKVIKDCYFFDYLVYLKNFKQITIRSFPYMDVFWEVEFDIGINYFDYDVEMRVLIAYSDKEKMIQVVRDLLNKDMINNSGARKSNTNSNRNSNSNNNQEERSSK